MKQEKKQALTEFHRHTIQNAAEKLFLEKGLASTSLDEIAKTAGYSKATLYVYFKSKADIWNNILLSAMKMLKAKVENAVLSDSDIIEKYFVLCEAIAGFSDDYPLYFESLIGMILLENEEVSRKIYEVGEDITGIVGQLIAQGVKEGKVRSDVQFPNITIVFWACISGMIRMANQKEIYFSKETGYGKKELLRYGFETLLRSIMN
ncbi:MAG: TetR/AcrR family transcriptional regulator [Christensenellaceae bacterium]|nr:TetR/AcrR family transcriptional regulator [Christensenellaceae bacterium]